MAGALDGVQLRTITSIDELAECQRWAGERREGPLCFDTESAGLSPYKDECRMIQIGDLRTGWAAPAKLWGGGLLEILSKYEGELAAHQSPYDWRVLAQLGTKLNWAKIQDTLIATHLYDSISLHGLKPWSARNTDRRAMVGEQVLKDAMAANHWTWATVPIDYPGYTAYAALDPVLTAHAWQKVGPFALGEFRQAYDLERATVRIAANMMDVGMMLDVPYIERSIEKLLAWERQAMAWLHGEFGITSVNSAAQIERALHAVGIPTIAWTKGGQPSIDKDTLKLYAHSYPQHRQLIETIGYARKTGKIVDTHLRKFLALRDPDDVIHATINTMQARTSRQSVTDPPMQTFDRDVPMIRGAYRPRPGNVFVTVDADQIEARLGAHFSNDPGMIRMFHDAEQSGVDFFRLMAGQIFGADPREIDKKDLRRQVTKNATYAKIYGSGLEKMALTAGVPVEQARPVYTAFGQLYPGLERLMQQLIRRARAEFTAGRRGYVTTPTGRQLYVDRGKEYAGLNYCLGSHTRVLMAESLQWMSISGLVKGDRIVAFDETSPGMSRRKMRTAEVEAVSRVSKPSVVIHTSQGPVTCSNDHLWLVNHQHNVWSNGKRTTRGQRWIRADLLTRGMQIVSTGKPWDRGESLVHGWLAGMLDGEGCLNFRSDDGFPTLTFNQNPGAVLNQYIDCMTQIGIPIRVFYPGKSTSPTTIVTIQHGAVGIMKTLGILQPIRWRDKYSQIWENRDLPRDRAEVLAVEHVGQTDLVSIQTSTRTLIADGLFSHNCIQGHAAEILKQGVIKLDAAGFGPMIRLTIHDEVVLECPSGYAEQVLHETERILTDRDTYRVPITWGGQILSERWQKS